MFNLYSELIGYWWLNDICIRLSLRAATDESQKTRNKKQETKRFSTFAVYRLRHSETKKKTLLDSRIKF